MAAFSSSPLLYMSKNPISLNFPSPIVFFLPCYHHAPSPHLHFRALCALKTGSDGGSVGSRDAYNSEILRKPVMSSVDDDVGSAKAAISNSDFGEPAEEGKKGYKEEDEWVDWEDRILQDTVPLVGFVRMILHSGRKWFLFFASGCCRRKFFCSLFKMENYLVCLQSGRKDENVVCWVQDVLIQLLFGKVKHCWVFHVQPYFLVEAVHQTW
ncbi:uncharacterized protein LOC122062425 isoform X1 [Macadamia integrifolia]|uniref:uncharacterized protein LOC122062425 isoform X1 n=1 Tax=Macadamia integrifolia TaxID=60698 RepID=UPI001C4FDFA0|nr:uncharacterized protein LOC122062425 isoform X1 [Macadamia integrifolia]